MTLHARFAVDMHEIHVCSSLHIFIFIMFWQLLSRLLKSKHPEDLQAANRLIKNMVKQVREKKKNYERKQTMSVVSKMIGIEENKSVKQMKVAIQENCDNAINTNA